MSYPINPLDDYRSYSYHTILLVANTTEALTPFTSSDPANDSTALSAITNTAQGNAVNAGSSTGEALLVLDSRRTSSFSIKEFNYSTYPGTGNPSQTHEIVGVLNMIIVDPDGITFINYLKYLIDEKLKTDLMGVHFLLKIIFVGHKADGSTTLLSTSAIPLMMYNLEFEVTFKEGIYTIAFVPMSQNVGTYVKNFTAVQDVKTITSEDGKLGTIIRNFENRLNENYRNWYKNCNIELKAAGDAQNTPIGKTGRLVQVMITIPKDWESFTVDNASFNTSIERRFKEEIQKRKELQEKTIEEKKAANQKEIEEASKKGVALSDAEKLLNREYIGFAPTLNVYEILSEIIKLCPEANALANRKSVSANLVKLFKTTSSITSNNEIVLVHFDILEFTVPNITLKDDTNTQYYVDMPDGKKIPKNSLEFDYIFTGKNTDILEFNLKMQTAQLLLMNTGKIGSSSHRMVNDQKKQKDNPITLNKTNVTFIRENEPITFPIQTIEARKNFASMPERTNVDKQLERQSDRNEWLQTVSKIHNQSLLRVKTTIRGNPNLMNKFVVEIIPPHGIPENIKIEDEVKKENFVKSSISGDTEEWQSQKEEYRKKIDDYYKEVQKEVLGVGSDTSEINGPKAHMFPMFIKINVFAPNNQDFGTSNMKLNADDPREFTQFWYDGWYIVYGILNKFSDGTFTQELDLMSYDVFGQEQSTTTGGADVSAQKEAHAASGAGGVMGDDGSVTAVSDKKPELYGGETRGKAQAADSGTSQNYGNEGSVGKIQQSVQNANEQKRAEARASADKISKGIKNFFTGDDKPAPPPPQLPGV